MKKINWFDYLPNNYYLNRFLNLFSKQGTDLGRRCSGFRIYPNGGFCYKCDDCKKVKIMQEWIKTSEQIPNQDAVLAPNELGVLGYNKKWIDVDFNPLGIRECSYCDNGWMSCRWNDYHGEYIHHGFEEEDSTPTHWQPFPNPPTK